MTQITIIMLISGLLPIACAGLAKWGFQDYNNLKAARKETPLDSMQVLYETGALVKLSEINLENIKKVSYLYSNFN
mgnify:CR=1 FL=1